MDVTCLQNVALPARGLRRVLGATAWPGVDTEADFVVGPRGAGANMSVDVAAGVAVVDGGARGSYVVDSGGAVNVAVGAAPGAGESRIDLVVLLVSDADYSGATNTAAAVVVAGTADVSPVAPAVPTGGLLLAQLLIDDATTSIGSGEITDKRGPSRPVTEWTGDPATGTDGQIVFDSATELRLRTGGAWAPYVPDVSLSAFMHDSKTMPDKFGPYLADSTWDSALTVAGGTPGQAAKVDVQVSVFGGGTSILVNFVFELQDGGSWVRSPVFPGGYHRSWSHVFATPTGSIQARIVMTDAEAGSGLQAPSGAILEASVSPVTV